MSVKLFSAIILPLLFSAMLYYPTIFPTIIKPFLFILFMAHLFSFKSFKDDKILSISYLWLVFLISFILSTLNLIVFDYFNPAEYNYYTERFLQLAFITSSCIALTKLVYLISTSDVVRYSKYILLSFYVFSISSFLFLITYLYKYIVNYDYFLFISKGRFFLGVPNPNAASLPILVLIYSLFLIIFNFNSSSRSALITSFSRLIFTFVLLPISIIALLLTASRANTLALLFFVTPMIFSYISTLTKNFSESVITRKNLSTILLALSCAISMNYFLTFFNYSDLLLLYQKTLSRTYSIIGDDTGSRYSLVIYYFQHLPFSISKFYHDLNSNFNIYTLDNSFLEISVYLGPLFSTLFAFYLCLMIYRINKNFMSPQLHPSSSIFFTIFSFIMTFLGNDFIHDFCFVVLLFLYYVLGSFTNIKFQTSFMK